MTLEEECRLSYYRKLTEIKEQNHVTLVKHVETGKLYVRKELKVYDKSVYQYLTGHPHVNLPRIYEVAESGEGLILIEEYINGESFEELITRKGTLSEREVIGLMMDVCSVLDYLHRSSPPIVHRDIKPSNIIISNDGMVKLVDLNTAKRYSQGETQDTVLIGTQEYAAPEQYGFRQSDARTDIYAAGVLMNYLLCGKYPRQELYSGSMRAVIERCIRMDPSQRYQSAGELQQELEGCRKNGLKEETAPPPRGRSKEGSWTEYLPPGFRTRKPWKMVVAVLVYLTWIALCRSLQITGGNMTEVYCMRAGMLLSGLMVIAFCFNYRGIRSWFPLMKSDRLPVKVLGYVLNTVLIVFVILFLAVIVYSILDPASLKTSGKGAGG